MLLVLLFLSSPLFTSCANTTDVPLGVLGSSGYDFVATLLLKAEAERAIDREVAERRHEVAEQRQRMEKEVAERRHEVAERRHEVAERRHEVAERRHEVAERRHESQLQYNGEISDAVVTAATSERVYACARAGAVLLETLNWAGSNKSYYCSATPLFTAQPQAVSTYFLTSAHCFTDITRGGSTFASSTLLHYHNQMNSCSLVRHFFCHPSTLPFCSQPSMDLAIVHCPLSVPVPSTRLSALPPQHFQRAFIYGFSDGYHLDPSLMHTHKDTSRRSALHLKFARLAPSIQCPQPLDLTTNVTLVHLPTTTTTTTSSSSSSSPGTVISCADLPPQANYQGFLDIVPGEGMSGGAVVDSQCGLLGVMESRGPFCKGGSFVSLSPSIVHRIMAAVGQL